MTVLLKWIWNIPNLTALPVRSSNQDMDAFEKEQNHSHGYKEKTQYDPRHYQNLHRIAKHLNSLKHDLSELIHLPENDFELENEEGCRRNDMVLH